MQIPNIRTDNAKEEDGKCLRKCLFFWSVKDKTKSTRLDFERPLKPLPISSLFPREIEDEWLAGISNWLSILPAGASSRSLIHLDIEIYVGRLKAAASSVKVEYRKFKIAVA